MPNPDKVVELGSYKLYVGMRAFRNFELNTGKSIINAFSVGNISMSDLAVFVKCALEEFHADEVRTLEQVDEIIDTIGLDVVLSASTDAISRSLPKPKNGATPNLMEIGSNP